MRAMPTAIVTGSGGLVGSESVRYFIEAGYDVIGLDNDMRAQFFGPTASTRRMTDSLVDTYPEFHPLDLDIRSADEIDAVVARHAAELSLLSIPRRSHRTTGQRRIRRPISPSTPMARSICSQAARRHAPDATFIFMSTNKVYGDTPNRLPLIERATRLELPEDHRWSAAIDTTMSIDPSHAFAVRGVQGGGRPARPGVRPLLRDADRLLPRRLPDRTQPCRRTAAWLPHLPDAVHGDRRPVHDLRL